MNLKIMSLSEWREIRLKILKRDNFTCKKCGITYKELKERYKEQTLLPINISAYGLLQIDHIKPLSQGGNPTDESNLQTLCHRCHALKDRKILYKNIKKRRK